MLSTFLLSTRPGLVASAADRLKAHFGPARLLQFEGTEVAAFGPEISWASEGKDWSVAFGRLDDPRQGSVASEVLQKDLADVHGSFGGVVRRGGSIRLVSDGLGPHYLRYAKTDGGWIVSPHDLALVAAGMPVELNGLALASILRIGWSFGNPSLLKHVHTLAPEEIVTLDGAVDLHPAHARAASRRGASNAEQIIEAMIRYVGDNHRAGSPLNVELSAGWDSRAVLAVALAAARKDVVTFTDGPPRSQDMRVARKVAAAAGVPHRTGGGGSASREQRLERFTRLAVATNGLATLMPIMTSSSVEPEHAEDSLGGDGLEPMRGYYYPKFSSRTQAFDPDALAQRILSSFGVGKGLLPDDPLKDHIRQRIERWGPLCRSQADAFDLLYMLERTGVWNQKLKRLPGRRLNPFFSHSAIYAFLSLPGQRGLGGRVHAELYRRFLPRARMIPLNGETLPILISGGRFRKKAARLTTLAAKVMWKALDRTMGGRAGTGSGDLEEVRRQNFADHLRADWAPLLEDENSVSRTLLDGETVQQLVAQGVAGDRRASELLSNLLVAEEFVRLAKAIADQVDRPASALEEAP